MEKNNCTIFLRSEQYCIRTVPDLVLYALLNSCAFAWTKLHTLKVYTLGHSNKLVVKRISWLVFSNMENKFNSCLNTFLEEQNFKVESLLRMRRMRIIQCDWCSDKLCMKIHGIPSCIFVSNNNYCTCCSSYFLHHRNSATFLVACFFMTPLVAQSG